MNYSTGIVFLQDLAEAEHHDLQPEEYADILDDAENDNVSFADSLPLLSFSTAVWQLHVDARWRPSCSISVENELEFTPHS